MEVQNSRILDSEMMLFITPTKKIQKKISFFAREVHTCTTH